MDKKSKIFFLIFFLLIVGSVAATYYRIVVKKDYVISAQTDCDPAAEKCFVWECDPASTVDGEACTGDAEADIWYYKTIKRVAANIPLCDPNDENCEALVCAEGEKDCEEILCSPETALEGETCNNPEEYLINNPPEEEVVCDSETDETCVADDSTEAAENSEAEALPAEETPAATAE
jgi:hypothetical protein